MRDSPFGDFLIFTNKRNKLIVWLLEGLAKNEYFFPQQLSLLYSSKSEFTKASIVITPPKTNMTMENPPFEDVFPIEIWDFPVSC